MQKFTSMQKAILVPLATSLLFAGSFITGKYTTTDLQPLTTSLLRYLFALLFLALCLATKINTSLRISRSHLPLLVLSGLLGIVAYHYFFFSALRYTTATNTALINAFNPVVTGLLAVILSKEKLSLMNYIGLIIGVIGVILLLSNGDLSRLAGLAVNPGDGLMLIAVISWALYALSVKKLARFYSSLTITFYATLFGVILLLCLVSSENWLGQIQHISVRSFWSLVYMGMAASGIGYLLYNLSIAGLGATRTSSIVYSLVPLFVAGLSWLFLAETITISKLCSGILILLSVNLVLRE